MSEKQHGVYFTDLHGRVVATCDCGWTTGPFPDYRDAANAYGDHRASEAEKVGAETALALLQAGLPNRST